MSRGLSGEGDTRTQGGSVQPTDAVAFRNPFPDAVPKAPLLRWVASNIVRLTLYLALASLSIAGYAVLAENAGSATLLGPSVIYFLCGAAFGIPGSIGWLLAVASFPPEWSMRRRRAMAVAMSPLIQLIWLVELVSWGYGSQPPSSAYSFPLVPRSSFGSENGGHHHPGRRRMGESRSRHRSCPCGQM
jgi:hypothetical protein